MGQVQAVQLPVNIGEVYSCLLGRTVWSVHCGKVKENGQQVTVFAFNFANKSNYEIKLARSAHLRLKTLRHPNVLKYIDGIELTDSIYMMTEMATPLLLSIDTMRQSAEHMIQWGLYQVVKSVSFITVDCGLIHNNLSLYSIFVDTAGEWKVGGVEFMYPFSDEAVPLKPFHLLKVYDTPEQNNDILCSKRNKWSVDTWGLGCLIWEVYNRPLSRISELRDTNKIPKQLIAHYLELVASAPDKRPSPNLLLQRLSEHGGLLHNEFISLNIRLEEIQVMESTQKDHFFVDLDKSLHLFPDDFIRFKILPCLLNAFEFGGAGSTVLTLLLKTGQLLSCNEYHKQIVPCIIKLFNSNDRATRLNLLQKLEQFMDNVDSSVINNQIFPRLTSGFNDTESIIREQTVKSILLIAPKLSDGNLHTQLLKHFAKSQMDEKASIRVNTTTCLSKIASYLNPKTRGKILVSAFSRSLKDPFPPARMAGVVGFANTSLFYTPEEIATKILPDLCPMTLDRDSSVRNQTFDVIQTFIKILEKHSVSIPLTIPKHQTQTENVPTEAGEIGWTGWAINSFPFLYGSSKTTSKTKHYEQTTDIKTNPQKPNTTEIDADAKSTESHTTFSPKPIMDFKKNVCDTVRDDDDDDKFNLEEYQSSSPNMYVSGDWDNENWDNFEYTPATSSSKCISSDESSSAKSLKDDLWTKIETNYSSSTNNKNTPPPVPSTYFNTKDDKQLCEISGVQPTEDDWRFDDGGWGETITSSKEVHSKKRGIQKATSSKR